MSFRNIFNAHGLYCLVSTMVIDHQLLIYGQHLHTYLHKSYNEFMEKRKCRMIILLDE